MLRYDTFLSEETGTAPPPAVFFFDNFNRSNENLEASPNWSRLDGGAAGAITVDTNAARVVSTSDGPAYACPDVSNLDHYVEATLVPTSGYNFFLCARLQDANNFIGVRRWSTGGNTWSLYKRVAGTFTELAAWTDSFFGSEANARVRLEVVGSNALVLINDRMPLVVGPIALGSHTSGARAGFITRDNAANPAWDDFEHDQLASLSTVPARNALLCHFDGTDGATASTDDGVWARGLTFSGNAQLDTAFAQFGASSLLLDGTGDFVTAAHHPDLNLHLEDFCVEGWVRTPSTKSGLAALMTKRNSSGTGYAFYLDSGRLRAILWNGSTNLYDQTASSAISNSAWHHFAITRSGTTVRGFIDGTQVITGTQSGNPSINDFNLTIGRDTTNTGRDLNGHLDEIRFRKGEAVYTSGFTPPASPFS